MPTALLSLLWLLLLSPNAHGDEAVFAVAGGNKPDPVGSATGVNVLSLKGSRGETLNFQLSLQLSRCRKLKVDPNGALISSLHFHFFSMPTVVTTSPSYLGARVGQYFDPLLPLVDGEVCPREGKARIWGEVEIDDTASARDYEFRISAGSSTLPVKIKVWHLVMPKRPSFPGYAGLSPGLLSRGHFGDPSKNASDLFRKYTATMAAHRLYPILAWINPPRVENDKKAKPILTWDVSSDPSTSLPNLPLGLQFDIALPDPKSSVMQRNKYWQAVENTIQANHWQTHALIYLKDEPKEKDFPALIGQAEEIHRLAPSARVLVTVPAHPKLRNAVDVFVVVMEYFENLKFPTPAEYKALQAQGKSVWWYVGCMSHGCGGAGDSGMPDFVFDRPSVYLRSIAWLAHRYGIEAFLYYSVDHAYKFYPQGDPWKSAWDFTGNGDGTLFYPGRPGEHGLKDHGPIASIRLKLWRETSFDAEYLKWLEEVPTKPAWWPAEYNRLVPSTAGWSRDYDAYQRLRDKMGDYLDVHAPKKP